MLLRLRCVQQEYRRNVSLALAYSRASILLAFPSVSSLTFSPAQVEEKNVEKKRREWMKIGETLNICTRTSLNECGADAITSANR